MAAAGLPPALLPSSLLVSPPVAGRSGDVIHLLVRGVAEGRSRGRSGSPEAGRAQGETRGGRRRKEKRGRGWWRREGRVG